MTEEQREAKRRAEVMLAFANGETIEATLFRENPQWEEIIQPQWRWDLRDYRVKPKPKKPRQCLILIEQL